MKYSGAILASIALNLLLCGYVAMFILLLEPTDGRGRSWTQNARKGRMKRGERRDVEGGVSGWDRGMDLENMGGSNGLKSTIRAGK
eukprot:1113830-Amorphochlora_amoeboformis.AAC.1